MLFSIGLGLMFGGSRRDNSLIRLLLAPFTCLGKTVLGCLFLSFGVLILADALLQGFRSPPAKDPQPTRSPEDPPLPTVSFDPLWIWPLGSEDAQKVTQSYAEYGVGVSTQYHAGIDIGAEWETEVRAPADGTVVKLQFNKGWHDHGLGNAVITRHRKPDGGVFFALFAHLEKIDARLSGTCGKPPNPTLGRVACAPPVEVDRGDVIGKVGSSGNGNPKRWGRRPHLHLEVRNFDTLGIGGDDKSGEEIAYVDSHPDERGVAGLRYLDPMLSLHGAKRLVTATRVVTKDVLRYRVGPGGRGGSKYRIAGQVSTGQILEAVAHAPPTGRPRCSAGWYQVRLTDGRLLPDALYPTTASESPPKRGLTTGWVCGDYLAQ